VLAVSDQNIEKIEAAGNHLTRKTRRMTPEQLMKFGHRRKDGGQIYQAVNRFYEARRRGGDTGEAAAEGPKQPKLRRQQQPKAQVNRPAKPAPNPRPNPRQTRGPTCAEQYPKPKNCREATSAVAASAEAQAQETAGREKFLTKHE